jgi:hypothetical protein
MATITQYQIVTGKNLPDLGSAVNALIGQGWQPLGSVQFQPTVGTPAQAMVQQSE